MRPLLFLTFLFAPLGILSAADPLPLYNGKDLTGWTTADGKPAAVSDKGWRVEEGGVLHRAGKGGDLYTAAEYGDFDLTWEWKIAPGGNSGLKYRVSLYGKDVVGPEYQLLDDSKHPDAKIGPKRQTASLYDILPPAADKKLKPAGEWNTSRIVSRGTVLEHWLNGVKVLTADTTTPEFKTARAASKFKERGDFAEHQTGRILLQDHGDEVWFRNLQLTPLGKP